jgi:hypothetical protein
MNPFCLTNQQESQKGSACDHPQTKYPPKTILNLPDNLWTVSRIQYHQRVTIESNDAPEEDMNKELRKWLKEHGLDVHDRFLLKHGIRSLTELRAAAESSSLETFMCELKVVQRKKLKRELESLSCSTPARTDSNPDKTHAGLKRAARRLSYNAENIQHNKITGNSRPDPLKEKEDSKFAADTITEYHELEKVETCDRNGRDLSLCALRHVFNDSKKGLESLMELEEDSESTNYNDKEVQIMHGEATCTIVNSRIQILRAKCLLLESAIQQKSNSAGRNEYAENACASDERWSGIGVKKKIAKAPRQVHFDLNNVTIHRFCYSSKETAPKLGHKHMEEIASAPSRQMTVEGSPLSPSDHFDVLGERICSAGKALVSRDNIIFPSASSGSISSIVEHLSAVDVTQATGDPVHFSGTSIRDIRARQDGTRGKGKRKRDLKEPPTNHIVRDAIGVGREAPSAAESSHGGQSVLNISPQGHGSRCITSQHIHDLRPRIKGFALSHLDAAYPSTGETPTAQPTTSISCHNIRSDEFIRAEVQSVTIEVDNDLAHMRGQNDIETLSSQARTITTLTSNVSQCETRSTISHHSSVDMCCLSCHRQARPALSLRHGRPEDFVCEYCGEHNTIFDRTSQKHTDGTSATLGMYHIRHPCTDCRQMLPASASSLHVNGHGQRWCCDCITQRNASVPCKHIAWLYLIRLCPVGPLLGWNCRCTVCCWFKSLVSQP